MKNIRIEEKAKAYDEALERASHVKGYKTLTPQEAAEYIFPQLHESEDEQTRKRLIDFISNIKAISESGRNSLAVRKDDAEMCDAFLLYLEKQKEQPKEELVYRLNGLMQEYIKEGKDDMEKEHRFKCYQLFWDALEDTSYFEQKEQKPIEDVVKDITKNKESATKFLKSAGIMDDNGELAEIYRSEPKPAENNTRTKIISRATSEKQVVLVSESSGNAEIGWDTRSLEDAKKLLEYGLAFINKQLNKSRKEHNPIFKEGDRVIWDGEEFNILDVNKDTYNVGGYIVPFSREGELHPIGQKSAEVNEYEIIKKHITEDVLSSEVNKRLKECGWYVTDEKPIEWSYDNKIQYDSVKSGIEAFASTYSFNIESKLFPQLTKEQQQLWREEIEQAVIAGGEDGIELARDNRYKENRTTEWSEEDGEKLNSILGTLHCVGKFNFDSWIKSLPERFDFPSKQEWDQDDEQYLLICKNALQKYQHSNQWDANIISDWLERRLKFSYQSKNEWSEEDDWKRKELIQYLEEKGDYRTVWMTWLKSLPERFSLEPKQEWSEADEKHINNILDIIDCWKATTHFVSYQGGTIDADIKWLKSLRPQLHWKFSKEQMDTLKNVAYGTYQNGNGPALRSLYEQLKKLGVKEEPEYYQHFDPDC